MIQKLFFGIAVPGYASLLIVVLFFGGLLLISNGIQGEYIARIYEEVKGRPLYVIGRTINLDQATAHPEALPVTATQPVAAAPPPPPPTPRRELPKPKPPVSPRAQ